jgi:hypothetical protein
MADSLATDTELGPLPTLTRRATTRWAALCVAVVAVAAVLMIWRYSTTATAFDTTGNVTVSQNAPVPGTAYNFTVLTAPLPDVEIQSAEVVLGDASGPAAIAVSLCRASSIGATAGELGDDCTSLDGVDLADVPETASIVITLVPLTQEPIHATGLRMRFNDGWRSGEQTVHLNLAA